MTDDTGARADHSSSTTSRRTSGCSTRSSPPRVRRTYRRRGRSRRALDAADIDLVLLDIVMPGMDGYEVCRRIRERTETAPAGRHGDRQWRRAEDQGLEAGDDFLTKPIDRSELPAAWRPWLGSSAPRTRSSAGRGAGRLEPRAGVQGGGPGVAARADGPAEAVPVAPARRAHRRPVTRRSWRPTDGRSSSSSATCAASRPSPRRASGGGRRRPAGVPRGAGRPHLPVRGHAGAFHRRRDDGVLQRPRQVRRRAAAGDPMAVPMRTRHGAGGGLGAAGSRPRFGIGIAQAMPPWAGSASRGATTTRPSATSPTSPHACAPTPVLADPHHREGVLRRPVDGR